LFVALPLRESQVEQLQAELEEQKGTIESLAKVRFFFTALCRHIGRHALRSPDLRLTIGVLCASVCFVLFFFSVPINLLPRWTVWS
jgi:hypothetical protein